MSLDCAVCRMSITVRFPEEAFTIIHGLAVCPVHEVYAKVHKGDLTVICNEILNGR